MDELIRLRQEIDEIDNNLIELFEKRMLIAKKVARYKKNQNIPIYDESRENEIIKKNIGKLNDKSLSQELESLYRTVFEISKDIQKKVIDNIYD